MNNYGKSNRTIKAIVQHRNDEIPRRDNISAEPIESVPTKLAFACSVLYT